MKHLTIDKIMLPLPRPQYVPSPESLITALAWNVFDVELRQNANGKQTALIFRGKPSETKTLEYRVSAPNDDNLNVLAQALDQEKLKPTISKTVVAQAVLNSIEGIKTSKGNGRPASPLTPSMALLQNIHGLMGTANPPSVDGMLEMLYRVGMPQCESSEGPAMLWVNAVNHRMDEDQLLGALDRAIDGSLLESPRRMRNSVKAEIRQTDAEPWQGLMDDTPYEWFYHAWNRLTSVEWVEALPSRVWVDWATTILRLAVGCGYLWEAAWFETLARQILGADPANWKSTKSKVGQVIPWPSARAKMSIRDVSSTLTWRVRRADEIRERLKIWLKDSKRAASLFDEGIETMRVDPELRDSMAKILSSRNHTSRGTNRWEAIKYSLVTRETDGQFADYYGLLKSHGARGRYLTVDPGTEWIAVVASLACNGPGTTTDVGTVMKALESLGLFPELGDLVALLERAGLARDSADADQGVRVQSAF